MFINAGALYRLEEAVCTSDLNDWKVDGSTPAPLFLRKVTKKTG